MKTLRIGYVLIAGALLAAPGCSSIDGDFPKHLLIPARTLDVSQSLTIPAESIAIGGIVFFIVDPLAPNWKVEVASLGMHRFKVDLTMKRFFTGGEGEVGPVLRRTAEKLRQEGGYSGYTVLEQSEGIESRLTLAQRVAHAVIELY